MHLCSYDRHVLCNVQQNGANVIGESVKYKIFHKIIKQVYDYTALYNTNRLDILEDDNI